MHYLSAENISKSFGIKPVFSNLSFHIEEGDKIALIAKNGSGKSTLLRIIAGLDTAEEGKVILNKEVHLAFFEQEPEFDDESSVIDNIIAHDHPILNAIKQYELLSEDENADHEELMKAITQLDELNAWNFDSMVKQILAKLNVHQLHQKTGTLSGGQRKRVALARTLIDIGFETRHTLLIMDEPTNHLDVEMVEWLENYLSNHNITLLLVTHDRYFLDNVCDEIWELSDNVIYTYKGDYQNFMEKKTARLESDAASLEKARNLFRRELEWMRKQPKARTTKSKSRIDAFEEVKEKAAKRLEERQLQLNVKMTRLGSSICECKKVYKAFGETQILKGFDYTFKRGERVGVIGKNGVGKSTFINILQGIEQPDSGKVNVGDTIVFGYFSQAGLEIKEDMRIIEFVKGIAENFKLADGTSLSASQFLSLFLFPPEQQYTYISKLSGGEKKRLQLLSILFRNPNFLILDEPTNDLDLETLTVLEGFLSEFPGCLIIVSHDRYFMDRLVDHLLVFEGDAVISDFPGNYSQYRDIKKMKADAEEAPVQVSKTLETPIAKPSKKNKAGFKEKREFELLEGELKKLNDEKILLLDAIAQAGSDYVIINKNTARIEEINQLLEEKEIRWLELSELIN